MLRSSVFARKVVAAAAISALAASVAACGSSSNDSGTAAAASASSGGATTAGSASSKDPIDVGAIYDLSGPLGIVGKPKVDATKLAIQDINDHGGVLGRPLKLHFYDAQSDNAKYTQYATKLTGQDHAAMIAAGITSASREAIRPIIDRTKTVYFYDQLYEGGVCDKNEFNTGPVPAQQLEQLIKYAIQHYGKRVYIPAADYNFGHFEAEWAKKYIKENGGQVVRTDFIPLDNTDFGSVLNTLQTLKPNVVVSLLVGGNHMSFYRQFAAAGLGKNIKIVTPLFGDGQEHIVVGPKASNGITVAFPYLQELNSPENQAFVSKWHDTYGADYPYITNSAVAAWNDWHLWAKAVEQAKSLDHDKVVQALESGLSIDSPSGRVTMDGPSHHVIQNVSLATAGSDGKFHIIQTQKAVPPSYEQQVCDLIKNPTLNKQFVPKG
jgi:urea transport system substrate-binding protein